MRHRLAVSGEPDKIVPGEAEAPFRGAQTRPSALSFVGSWGLSGRSRVLRDANFRWIVVAGVTTVLTVSSGARFLFGVVLKPVSQEFGWTRADLTIAVLINMAALSALQPLVGSLVDRIGPKVILVAGVILLSVVLVPISFARQLWHFYLLYGLIAAVGMAATSPVNTTSLVTGWFQRRRGTALAIATSGSAFGQLLIVPLATLTLRSADWQTVYRVLAIVLLVVITPIALFLVREAPGDRLERTGSVWSNDRGSPAAGAALRHAFNGSPFWLLAFGFFSCGFTMAFASTHFLAYADDMGMTPVRAADVVAVTAVFSIVGSVLLGLAADRFRRVNVLALTYALRGLAFLLLLLLPVGPLMFCYALVLGISWTATTPLTAAIATDLYGRARLGLIFGTMFTFMNIGFGAGSFLDGLVYDSTGSYGAALVVNAALGGLAAAAVWRVDQGPVPAGRPADPQADAPLDSIAEHGALTAD